MVFLDNASTTKCYAGITDIMAKYNTTEFYNPSAPYGKAVELANEINDAKSTILKALGGTGKFIFTGSATESNNTVLLGQLNKRFKKVLVSQGEHSSIHNAIQAVRNAGFIVEEIPLTKEGTVSIEAFKQLMTKDVGLVSVIHVSNETGAINPIKELVNIAKAINPNVLFHSDGVQAFMKINVNLDDLGVDFYTISGHKIHAPKGIAGLYIRKNLKPFLIGGGQQEGLRGGTENVAGILSLKYAIDNTNIHENNVHVSNLRKLLVELLSDVDGVVVNSRMENSPYIVSIGLTDVNGETMVHALESDNILVGMGSACSSKSKGNHTLLAMGLSQKEIKGNLRVSFSAENTEEEIHLFVNKLSENLIKLKNKITAKS